MRHLIAAVIFVILAQPAWAGAPLKLLVGPTVHVSAAYPRLGFRELTADADPLDPHRLVTCIIMSAPQPSSLTDTSVLFESTDSGMSWHPLLESRDSHGLSIGDPVCKYDRSGDIQYVTLTNPGPIAVIHSLIGNSWRDETIAEADRETLIVGPSNTMFLAYRAGSLGALSPQTFRGSHPEAVDILKSDDRGRSFAFVTGYAYDQPYETAAAGIGAMFTNGSVAIPVAHFVPDKEMSSLPKRPPHVSGNILVLTPGSLEIERQPAPNVVSSFSYCRFDNALSYVPVLAIDTSRSQFRNRAYLVWGDYRNSRCQEMISTSIDRGHKWTAPHPVSDDRSVRPNGGGPDDGTQAIAVNNRGAVGVMWYDRRNAKDDLSYQPRFAVSVDGGKTFSPSVPLTSAMNDWQRRYLRLEDPYGGINTARSVSIGGQRRLAKSNWSAGLQIGDERGGETSGLTVDTQGVFHAFWVDDRTNVTQLYTASVSINGQPQGLAQTPPSDEDVQQLPGNRPSAITTCPAFGAPLPRAHFKIHFSDTWIDQETGLLSTDLYLIPAQNAASPYPVLFSIASLRSKLGIPSALDAAYKPLEHGCFEVKNGGPTHLAFRLNHYQHLNVHNLENIMQYLLVDGRISSPHSATK